MNPNEQPYSQPTASKLSKIAVSNLAEKVAKDIGFNTGGSIDETVVKLGGKITYQPIWDLEGSNDGSIIIEDTNNFHIFMASHTFPERNRFTIAHELGHYVLHYLLPKHQGKDVGKIKAHRYGGADRTEYEANWFAAAFLMPSPEFTQAFGACQGDFFAIASQFRVSYSAAEIRAKSLNLINQS